MGIALIEEAEKERRKRSPSVRAHKITFLSRGPEIKETTIQMVNELKNVKKKNYAMRFTPNDLRIKS